MVCDKKFLEGSKFFGFLFYCARRSEFDRRAEPNGDGVALGRATGKLKLFIDHQPRPLTTRNLQTDYTIFLLYLLVGVPFPEPLH